MLTESEKAVIDEATICPDCGDGADIAADVCVVVEGILRDRGLSDD